MVFVSWRDSRVCLPYTQKVSSGKSFVDFVDDPSTTKLFLRNLFYTSTFAKPLNFLSSWQWRYTGISRKKSGNEAGNPLLPDEKGPLSKLVPSSYISEANKEVSATTNNLEKRGPYLKLTPEKKADIDKYAAENGIKSAVRHFSKDFSRSNS